eukprot:scaffold259041_cov17-Prasinocladus_malaysianus.AAC.1
MDWDQRVVGVMANRSGRCTSHTQNMDVGLTNHGASCYTHIASPGPKQQRYHLAGILPERQT